MQLLLPRLHFLFFSILIVLCTACVPKQSQIRVPTPEESKAAWYAFTTKTEGKGLQNKPFRVSASLQYSGPDIDSARVTSFLWGNNISNDLSPLRFDVTAGLGTIVAKARESGQAFTIYAPTEKTAFSHTRDNRSLISFGVPIPLTLRELALILTGDGAALFLPQTITAEAPTPTVTKVTPDGVCFAAPSASLPGILELSPDGTLLSWQDYRSSSWHIKFIYDKKSKTLPERLVITHPKGYKAIVTLKDMTLPPRPYTVKEMDLILPPGTMQKELGVSGY